MQQAGTSPKIIKQTLANDMGTGGRIFGQLRNDTKASIVDGINQSAKMGQYKNYDLDKGEFVWVAVGGHKVCMDCDARAGQKMTFAGWESEGLPGSGWSVCQGFCYCVLDPTGKASMKIDAPVKEPGAKVKPVKSTEKLKNWFASDNKRGNKEFFTAFKDSSAKFHKFLTSFPRMKFIGNGGRVSHFTEGRWPGGTFRKWVQTAEQRLAFSQRGGINIRRWNSKRVHSTIRHEMGHYMHNMLHQPTVRKAHHSSIWDNWNIYKRNNKSLKQFFKNNPQLSKSDRDWLDFKIAFEDTNIRINKSLATIKERVENWAKTFVSNNQEIRKGYYHINHDANYMMDLFGAITKEKIGYGHGISYYNRVSTMQFHETFANLTWAYSHENPVIWKMVKKELPELAKYYEGVVDTIVADGNFQTLI